MLQVNSLLNELMWEGSDFENTDLIKTAKNKNQLGTYTLEFIKAKYDDEAIYISLFGKGTKMEVNYVGKEDEILPLISSNEAHYSIKLTNILLQPVFNQRKESSFVIMKSGILHNISFASLPLTKNKLVIDKYKLKEVLTFDNQISVERLPARAFLIGNVDYNTVNTTTKEPLTSNEQSTLTSLTRGEKWNELLASKMEITEGANQVSYYDWSKVRSY